MKRREFMAAMLAIPVAPAAVREVSNAERIERWLLAPHPFGSVGAINDDLVVEGIQKAIAMCREDVSRAWDCGPRGVRLREEYEAMLKAAIHDETDT